MKLEYVYRRSQFTNNEILDMHGYHDVLLVLVENNKQRLSYKTPAGELLTFSERGGFMSPVKKVFTIETGG